MKPLDDADMMILTSLEKNVQISYREMANQLAVSVPTVYNRVRRLKRIGVIKKIVAEIDYEKLGYIIRAFVGVSTSPRSKVGVLNKLRRLRHVHRICEVTGRYDYVLEIVAKDTEELRRLLTEEMGKIGEVQRTETMVIMHAE